MGRITVLPREVADQIAAGEVVERPASVVKELVENALDAGAMSITVELEDGGRTLVRVSDDGVGMDREDALLALDRHATSKIRSARDLVGVPTYGFRGEALPAIASVAELQLETAPAADRAQANLGTSLVVKGGRVERVESSARAAGTTVTVRRLFFNTPARRKFLRSQRSETRAAVETLTVLALARLDVSFTLVSDGRSRLEAPRVAGFGDRVASLFGRRTAEELIPVEHHLAGVSVRGFVQRPAEAKAAGRKAHLFVNGRPFRDPFLVRAAEAGYRATIAPGLRPTLLLSLGVPGDGVDVNVHPAKLEVRFRDRMLVERAVEEAVRSSLRPMEAAAVVGHPPYADDARPAAGSSNGHQSVPIALFDSDIPAGERKLGHAVGQDILQIFDTYLVFETLEGMVFVDQHSAHERVLYERAMAQLRGEGSAAQRLLLPLTVDLSPEELEAVEDHANLLSAVGYEIEPFGGRSVVVHAVPNPHPRFDARRCVEELTADLARGRFGGFANRLERFAATFACRAAIKAGHTLDRQERRELLRRLFACELPPHDVHGRPTIVQLPKDELERRFGRS
jgi:DNA mismatch repair protein MutL